MAQSPAAILNILLTANTTQANAALMKTNAQLTSTAARGKAAGATLGKAFLGIGVAAGAAAVALYKVGEAFDDSFDTIRVQTGATGKDLQKLKGSFKDVVRDVPVDFETASKAIAEINQRMGLTGKPLERMTKQMTELSRITGTDVETNVENVTRAFGDWEVKTKDQNKQLDIFFRASQDSGAAVADLAEQVVQFGAPLRQVGFSLDEATAMFALFEKAGVNTQTMMPGLKFALRSFMEAGKDPQQALQKTFEGIADGTLKAKEAFEIFGGRATPDMIEAIQQGRFELDKFTDSIVKGDDSVRKAGRQTMDFTEQWQKFKNNAMLALLPVARKVFRFLSDEMKAVTDIMSDKNLSQGQKMDALADLVHEWMVRAIEKMGEVAPKLAGAFVKGFINAPILGQLLIGGWLFSKMGGATALTNLGTKSGKVFGRAFAYGAVALFGFELMKWLIEHREEIINAAQGSKTNIQDITEELGVGVKQATAIQTFQQKHPGTSSEFAQEQLQSQRKIEKSAERHQELLTEIQRQGFKERNSDAGRAMRIGAAVLDVGHDVTKRGFENTRKRLNEITREQWKQVGGNVGGMVNAVGQGLKTLGKNTNNALKAYGVKDMSFAIETVGKGAQAVFKQRGGHINTGAASGDSVPAMLERGEYVLNRNAVSAVGKGNLDRMNSAVPRFQKGGMAAMTSRVNQFDAKAFPYVWGGGHGGFGLQPVDCSGFVSDVLNQGGLLSGAPMVSGALAGWGKPGKGPLTVYANSGHTLMSLNGKFAGTSGSNPGGGAGWIPDPSPSYLAGFTARTMGVVGAEIKRLMLEGPKGPLRSMGQGALDKTYKAAKSYLAKQQPSGTFGGGDVMTGSGDVESMFAKVAKRISTSKIATLALGMAGYAESGMQDLAGGHSTSQGALQLLSSTAAGLGVSPHDEQAIASLFLQRGFYGRGGANSLASQGYPAHMVAQLVQGSAFSSGSNYLAQAGAARAWMSRYGLQRGGMPTLDKGGRVTQSGIAQVHPGDVHMGKGGPNINVYVDPVSLDVRVETIVEGMAPEIAEFTARQLGRGAGRSRQLSRG